MGFSSFTLQTNSRTEMTDITHYVKNAVKESNINDGICLVYSPHTTAGITINENADPDVQRDILLELYRRIPFDDGYKHREGNSAAHIKTLLTGPGQTIPVHESQMVLGIWQGIYFCEYDGPRRRTFYVQVIGTK